MVMRIKKIIKYGIPAVAWFFAAMIVVEITLRTIVRTPILWSTFDAQMGNIPAAGNVVVWGTEGFGITHYSANSEIATPYTEGDPVIVLGDSHTQALHVNDNEKFVSLAEISLRQDGYHADLHNLGDSGSTIADYVYLAPIIRARYNPKIVVIQISQSDFGQEGFNVNHPNYFVADQNGPVSLVHVPQVVKSLSLASTLQRSFSIVAYGYIRFEEIVGLPKQDQPARFKNGELIDDTFNTMPAQLNELRSAYDGVSVIIILVPQVPKIEGNTLVTNDATYEALLRRAQGISEWKVIDPLPEFQAMIEQGQLPRGFSNTLPGVGHLNASAHRIVGRLLAKQIEEIWH
jgi:lysophospholipase L1-like esterase